MSLWHNAVLAQLLASGAVAWSACCPCRVAPEEVPADWQAISTDGLKSPGRIRPADYTATFQRLIEACQQGATCSAKPRGVGHVAGSLRRYPMAVRSSGAHAHGWGRHTTCAENVNTLMDRAFSELHLDGIEIDTHSTPGRDPADCSLDRPCASVVHDEPRWDVASGPDSAGKKYLTDNSLVKVLGHFAERYATQGRHLFLELKEPKGCSNADLGKAGKCASRIHGIVRDVAAVHAVSSLADRLDFISFSRHALDSAHEASLQTALNGHVGFQFIAGVSADKSNVLCRVVALTSQPVDEITRGDLNWLAQEGWISGVWFSPFCYPDAAQALAAINRERAMARLAPLQVGISTYQERESDILGWLKMQYREPSSDLAVIASFIVDIDG